MNQRKTASVKLPADVCLEAESLGLDVAQLCEKKLRDEIQALKDQDWNLQHARFLAAYNSNVEREDVALQEWRAF
jgi:antitoxin CcdA